MLVLSEKANRREAGMQSHGSAKKSLQTATPFTVRRADATGTILETKAFEPLPAVSQFTDSLGYYPGLWYRPATDGLYFWQAEASAVIPAQGNYTTRITKLNKSPEFGLYGYDLGWTVLGSGNPGDSGVQYGLNIAVLDKAQDGSWGKIAVWNATSLVNLEMNVDLAKAFPGQTLMYQLKVRNQDSTMQPFAVSDPIPANTTYLKGDYYNADTNSIEWTGMINPGDTMVSQFWVTVDQGTPAGTEINNVATLSYGSSASATTIVNAKKK